MLECEEGSSCTLRLVLPVSGSWCLNCESDPRDGCGEPCFGVAGGARIFKKIHVQATGIAAGHRRLLREREKRTSCRDA